MGPSNQADLDEIAARVIKRTVKSSPWLTLSLVFHAGVLAVLPLVSFYDQIADPESIPVTIGVEAKRIDPERNYKPVSGGPPSADGEGLEEPPLLFPDAERAERNESANEDDRHRIQGQTLDTLTHFGGGPEEGHFLGRRLTGPPGTNDVMGVGGGSGSGMSYGGRAGGRRNLAARGGGSAATEAAVEAGLAWLTRHQCPDGHFEVKCGDDAPAVRVKGNKVELESSGKLRCGKCTTGGVYEDCTVGATALAAMAYIAAGYTPTCGDGQAKDESTGRTVSHGPAVRAALKWLAGRQDGNGRFKDCWEEGNSISPMYDQAFATLAFCEAYRATRSKEYEEVARKGIAWLEGARNSSVGGWRYHPHAADPDLSVTGACVQALRGARLAGLSLQEKTISGVETFLDKVTDKEGHAGYQVGQRELGASLPAIGIFVRRFIRNPAKGIPHYESVATHVEKSVTQPRTGYSKQLEGYSFETDFYLWYYAMLALHDSEGPSGSHFKRVNQFVTTELVKLQKHPTEGCCAGSWDNEHDLYLAYGGRACATALNVLTLEVYYRYATETEENRQEAKKAKD